MHANILALDTSTEQCSAALLYQQQVYQVNEVCPRGHADKILPMVDSMLTQAGISLQQLDAIAFGRGPGSFTGVRIGTSVVQGLAFAADLPVLPISTLMTMAQASYRIHQAEQVACAIDARMQEVYWGCFRREAAGHWCEVDSEKVIAPESLVVSPSLPTGEWWQAGTGWQAYDNQLQQLPFQRQETQVLYPEAQDMLSLACFAWSQGQAVTAEQANPVYLRNEVTWKKIGEQG